MATTRTRQPVKPLAKSPEQIAADAKAEKARKAASRKALAQAKKDAAKAETKTPPATSQPDAQPANHADEYAANAVATAEIDAEALGIPVEQVLADMGLNPKGYPLTQPGGKYTGSMLILRTAAQQYVKGANGNPHCGDALAAACGQHPRDVVVRAMIRALNLPANPYTHLNPGQQSMNLRNKARAAIKNGMLQIERVAAELKQAAGN